MLNRFSDLDRTFTAMDQLRRLFEEYDPASPRAALSSEAERLWARRFPSVTITNEHESLVLKAELPGLGDKDVQLSIHQDVLTLSGERKADAPEGYYVHRQERAPVKFARSFSLPCKVDPETSTATLKNGVLTVTLKKAPEAQPRQIAVKAQ